jgi:hypothetical protein
MALGVAGHVVALVLVGAAVAAALTAVVAPEVILVAFLIVGGVRAAPWLASVPVNLTLVTWLGTVLALVVHGLRPGRGIPRLPTPLILVLLLVIIVLLSDIWSIDPAVGLSKALKFEFLTMTALVGPFVLIRTRGALFRAAGVFVAFGLLIALTTVRTTNVGEPLAAAGGNEIQAGLYPALGVIALLGYMLPLASGRKKVLVALPLAILVPAVVGAGSRGALVSLVLALIYLAARFFMRSRNKLFVGVLIVVTLAVLLVAGPTLAGGATSRYEQSLLTTNPSKLLGDRRDLMGTGLVVALAHPVSGVGVGGYAGARFVYEAELYPHNILVELGAEEGLTAVALFVVFVICAWRVRGRVASGVRGPEAMLTGALLLALVAEAMVSFDINGNRIMWFALGLALALPALRVDDLDSSP